MARLPSRKELAAKVDQLERDLAIFAGGAGTGALLRASPALATSAATGIGRLTPAALAADLLIRQEEALLARGANIVAEPFGEQFSSGFTSLTSPTQVERKARAKPKKKSRFNKAVSAGLKALKGSASYGKKGVISNAKAAFRTATKAASARSKGRKMPKSGPSKVAYKAAKGVYTDEILRRKMK
jgi:hypothetical protein